MNIQAKILNCPQTAVEMACIVDQWNECGVSDVYMLAQQIESEEVRIALKNYSGNLWVVLQTLLDIDDGRFPLAVTDKGEYAIGNGDGVWLRMVCPRGVDRNGVTLQSWKEETIRNVIRSYNPDGISLDFIRHFVFWEAVYEDTNPDQIPRSCFCSTCRNEFSRRKGIVLPANQIDAIKVILRELQSEWEEFSVDTITELVRTLVTVARKMKSGIAINIHAVPWGCDEFDGARVRKVGQNFQALAPLIDQVSPMCYSPMLKRSYLWIEEVVNEIKGEAGKLVVPAIQICEMYGTVGLSSEEFREMVTIAGGGESDGVVVWPWERLTHQQLEILRSLTV